LALRVNPFQEHLQSEALKATMDEIGRGQ